MEIVIAEGLHAFILNQKRDNDAMKNLAYFTTVNSSQATAHLPRTIWNLS